MRLPIIKHITEFIDQNDRDFVLEAIETLESLAEAPGIKDEEMDVIGELISNLYGAIEVDQMVKEEGLSAKDALNTFMKRVVGSIDR